MSVVTLQLTARDPLVARDGRPFGEGQGNRMRGLGWPLPSVVAGSFRTALVKANSSLSFDNDMPAKLMQIEVAGVFPAVGEDLYLPAPNDCAWDDSTARVFRTRPVPLGVGEGVDLPVTGLDPVRLTNEQAPKDFKAKPIPAWWPRSKYVEWLTSSASDYPSDWFAEGFLAAAEQEIRDHVRMDEHSGAAKEGHIFSTAGLAATHLPRFGVKSDDTKIPFPRRFAEIALAARVAVSDPIFGHVEDLNVWHPLGGERRLVHWQKADAAALWECPKQIDDALASVRTGGNVRMALATPAVFAGGWRPGWIDATTLTGQAPGGGPSLKLVGVSNPRWKAVSGWSLAPPRGPKPIRRMAPAGSVYFFKTTDDEAGALAARGWLRPVSDGPQDRNDGFGLAVWGTW